MLHESISKSDKYCEVPRPKKRRWSELTSKSADRITSANTGNHIHGNPNVTRTQRLEKSRKSILLNKLPRTSTTDAQLKCRSTAPTRQQMVMGKCGDAAQTASGCPAHSIEKRRRLQAGGEGLEQEKKKRSVGSVDNRIISGECDTRLAFSSDSKLRLCYRVNTLEKHPSCQNTIIKGNVSRVPQTCSIMDSKSSGDHPSSKLETRVRKNKISTNELGGGLRKQGMTGRDSYLMPLGTPVRDKVDNPPISKPLLNMKPNDKSKRMTGSPLSKKQKGPKVLTHTGQSLNFKSSDFTGESVDDYEELHRDASNCTCSGPVGRKTEMISTAVTLGDTSYLKQQGVFINKVTHSSGEFQGTHMSQELAKGLEKVAPLYKRVLSALIEEDKSQEPHCHIEGKSMSLQCASDDSSFGSLDQMDFQKDWNKIEPEIKSTGDPHSQKNNLLDGQSCDRCDASNDDSHLELNVCEVSSSDGLFQLMHLDDRLLLELNIIGLFPEMLPNLADVEEEEAMNPDIMEPNEWMCQQGSRGNSSQKSAVRETTKCVESAVHKHIPARSKKDKEACHSCINEATPQGVTISTPPCNTNAKSADRDSASVRKTYNEYSHQLEARISGTSSNASKRHESHVHSFQGVVHSSEQESSKNGLGFTQEMLIDNVLAPSRAPVLDGFNFSIIKRKRSIRKNICEDHMNGNPITKTRWFPLRRGQMEFKQKVKPKHKSNVLESQGRSVDKMESASQPVVPSINNKRLGESATLPKNSQKVEDPVDSGNFQPNESESELLDGSNDLNSWLNVSDDGMPEDEYHDGEGLAVPNDILTDIPFL